MNRPLEGRVAIVTGAGRGLGAGIARSLAAAGAAVALAGRTAEPLESVEREIRGAGGRALSLPCDVSSERDTKRLIAATLSELGGLDILVNNAAAPHRSLPIEELPLEEWERQLAVNLTGAFLCSKAAIPTMKAAGYGKILNISSSAASAYFPGFGAYSASKAGLLSLTRSLSEELKGFGINVNAINLGMTDTDRTRERLGMDVAVSIPLEEMLKVDDVAKVALFLVSDDAAPVMGAAIDVLGRKA